MEIGIAYDLRSDFEPAESDPTDRLEEYDSEATVSGVARALEELGHGVRRLGGGRRFLESVLAEPPELVFNIAEGHGTRSREAHVPSVLEMLGIPYTHSDPLTLAVTLDKGMAKRLVAAAGVPTPRYAVLDGPESVRLVDLPFPVIAKPLCEGSSMGIRNASRITERAALEAHVARLRVDYAQPVLVEEFCPGPEYTVGILGTGAEARVLGVMEIVPKRLPRDEFIYSLEVKRVWEDEVEYHVPPRRSRDVVRAVEDVALGSYRALGCRDVARVDVRTGADGRPQFLEINPLPGLHYELGDLVILARLAGLPFVDLVGRIVEGARSRQRI